VAKHPIAACQTFGAKTRHQDETIAQILDALSTTALFSMFKRTCFLKAARIHAHVHRSYLKSSDPLPDSARAIMKTSGCKMSICQQL
jgi:hypothetical protein